MPLKVNTVFWWTEEQVNIFHGNTRTDTLLEGLTQEGLFALWYGAINKQPLRERIGSVVECLTRDRGAACSSLTGVTALCPFGKTHSSLLSTGPTQEDQSPSQEADP